jgi:V8-like Glu-specific endopeptidase
MNRLGLLSLSYWAVAASLALGCGNEPPPSSLPSLYDVRIAPPPIQTAAEAVVRVHTAGQYGTGAFVSPTGLLLTNDHILGDTVCPVEGCTIQLSFDHQRGKPPQNPVTVSAVPQAVDVGLDMALVQIRNLGGGPFSTPAFLNVNNLDAAALVGAHVTVVGHPEGELKKWSSGLVTDAFGTWFTTTAYTLPGDSGSPVLDDAGNLVGIIHRGATGEDLISGTGVNVWSTGTASAALTAAMSAPLPAVMVSLAAPTTAAALVARDLVYLNGGLGGNTVMVDGTPRTALSVLGDACDAALARTDFVSPDDLTTALVPCNDATRWIECRVDASAAAYATVCPSTADAASWSDRYDAMNQAWVAMNGNTDLSPVSFGVAALSLSKTAGLDAGAARLTAVLAAVGSPIDFSIANDLAAFGVESYAGGDSLAWLRSYPGVADYQLYASSIASAFLWWNDNGQVAQDELVLVLGKLVLDPNVSIGSKLYIDQAAYDRGN